MPTPDESAPSKSANVDTTESTPEATTVTEDKPKDDKKKEDEPSTEAPESKDEAKEEPKDESASERQPKEQSVEEDVSPQEPSKFIFVTQHVRDPVTGVVYTRQVPLIPSNYLRPLPYQPDMRRGQVPMPPMQPEPEKPQEPSSFDPLGKFNDQQKKRQFYQDMLMTQLSRFEKEIEPMMEREENITQKNDIEDVMGSVAELKQKLEHFQLFNISEIMNNWKQGKLAEGQGEQSMNEPRPVQIPQPGYGRPQQRPSSPPVALRTLILVPHNRVMNQQPQQQQFNPYPQMNRQVPMIHIRRVPYQQSMYESEAPQQQQGKPTEQLEPQPAASEEYGNNNEIFGY